MPTKIYLKHEIEQELVIFKAQHEIEQERYLHSTT
jgi:hypothetical protein